MNNVGRRLLLPVIRSQSCLTVLAPSSTNYIDPRERLVVTIPLGGLLEYGATAR